MHLLSTSLFYRAIKKENFVPDIYKESITMTYILKPVYLWMRSFFPFSRTLPQIVLGLAILIFSFYNPIISHMHLAKSRLGLVLLPAVLIMGLLKTDIKVPQVTLFDLPLFFLLLISIVSLCRASDIYVLFFGLRELMSLCVFIMSIYLVIYIFTKKDIKRLFYALGAGGIGASIFFILYSVFFKNGEAYLRNTFGNPNHLGYFLFLLYPVALAVSLDTSSKLKYFWRAGVVLIIAGIFFTYSLGAWISFFLSLPFLAISFRKKWPLVFPALLILVFILCPFIRHRAMQEISLGRGSSIMARIEVWKAAMASIYERPILGIGLGQFAASAKPYYAKQMYNAFSVFFHLAATTGIPGLVFFLWFLVRAFKLNISILNRERLYGAGLLTSLAGGVIGFFWDTHLLAVMTNWLLGLLLGSCAVMARQGG